MKDFIEVSAKNLQEAVTEALVKLEVTSDKMEYEVLDKGSAGILGMFNRPAVIKAWKKVEAKTVQDIAEDFLKEVFEAMNLTVDVQLTMADETNMNINLIGEDMGIMIGKRGQTLDSLQYLTSLVVNKNQENYIRVKVDTENYRERRQNTLERLAKNVASKVKRTRKPVSLEPMNPYERRIIHSVLQTDKYIFTKSEGEEPYRYIVVSLKKRERYEK